MLIVLSSIILLFIHILIYLFTEEIVKPKIIFEISYLQNTIL